MISLNVLLGRDWFKHFIMHTLDATYLGNYLSLKMLKEIQGWENLINTIFFKHKKWHEGMCAHL